MSESVRGLLALVAVGLLIQLTSSSSQRATPGEEDRAADCRGEGQDGQEG